MDKTFVARQLELYSNAIVGFMVVQSLGYVYYFGTNCLFNYAVKNAAGLAEGLTFLLSAVAALSVLGILALSRALQRISGEHSTLLRRIYIAKAAVVLVFGALPAVITMVYAILSNASTPSCD